MTWDWSLFFERRGPVEVELGCGRGGFLQRAAEVRPESNFLGIDHAGKYLAIAARRLSAAGIANVALFYGTHETLLPEIPPESVDVVHFYFPDPWHKVRHARRRGVRPELLQCIHRALKPGGELRLRTDMASYFDEMLEVLGRFRPGFDLRPPLVYTEPPSAGWLPTNYERRFLAEGIACRAIAVVKAPAAR